MIHRLKLTNYMGIAVRELEFPPGGAVIEGGNAKGKTTILKAIRAALAAHEIGPDAIRKGADAAEILVMVDDIAVRRVLTLAGGEFRTSLRVSDENGKTVGSGQTFLKTLLGMSPLDPIELFQEKDAKKRRAKILSAVPCAVTEEQLLRWVPPGRDLSDILGRRDDGELVLAGHGLDVLAKVRAAIYAERTEANRDVSARERDADVALARAGSAAAAVTAYAERYQMAIPVSIESAEAAVAEARAREATLYEQERIADEAETRQARARARIAELRARAAKVRAEAPALPTEDEKRAASARCDHAQVGVAQAEGRVRTLETQVAELQRLLEEARAAAARAQQENAASVTSQNELFAREGRHDAELEHAMELDGQAKEMEEAIGGISARPTEERIAEARAAVARAVQALELGKLAAHAREERAKASRAKTDLEAAQTAASILDQSVTKLTNDAPAALLAASDGIQGLTVDSDDILLDGVSLDRLSGMERLSFAVQVARRLNAKSKLLCVDGLETLDAEHREAFMRMAVADGYQLIATRVIEEGGEAVVHPIEEA